MGSIARLTGLMCASWLAACALGTAGGEGNADGDATKMEIKGNSVACDPTGWCIETLPEWKVAPLALFVVVDRSSSMESKWDAATEALGTFFRQTEGVRVALDFFPPNHDHDLWCSEGPYSNFDVAVGDLEAGTDAHESKLIAALAAQAPGANATPTWWALKGAYTAAATHAETHPGDPVAVLLLTDGAPSGCQTTPKQVTTLVDKAHSAGTSTFVIGLPGSEDDNLDAWAEAGGTDEAYVVEEGAVGTQLLSALDRVKNALPCLVHVPEESVEAARAAVCHDGFEWPEVSSAGACLGDHGWHYDQAGTSLVLCPKSCVAARQAATDVDVVFGCPIDVPR